MMPMPIQALMPILMRTHVHWHMRIDLQTKRQINANKKDGPITVFV